MARSVCTIVALTLLLVAGRALAENSPSALRPGATLTIAFPELPPTYYALAQKKNVPAQMTIFLPTNYDPARKHPLFIFLSGGDGGAGGDPAVARAITQEKDFVCVSMPLFRAPEPQGTTQRGTVVISGPDGRAMWPCFRAMLAKLDDVVPNLDPAHQVLGGFSNGAHATAALLDESDGAVARRFSAFFFGEGGGKLQHYELLRGKSFLMLSSQTASRPRAEEIRAAAEKAGAATTFLFDDIGRHGFAPSAYPGVRAWLHDAAAQR